MKARQPSVRILFIVASFAVLCLLALSDFKHDEIRTFSEMPSGGERVRVSCVVIDCKASQKGWVLTIGDYLGDEARAFLSKESCAEPPATGTVIELAGQVSEDQTMIFIDTVRVLTTA